ncbi:histidine phosphatase family protein, partial [Clostridioides difficile]
MQSIYLIRHAKATGQEPHAELTDEGIRQAEKLADILAHHSITYIVSSPWKRAVQTAMP